MLYCIYICDHKYVRHSYTERKKNAILGQSAYYLKLLGTIYCPTINVCPGIVVLLSLYTFISNHSFTCSPRSANPNKKHMTLM